MIVLSKSNIAGCIIMFFIIIYVVFLLFIHLIDYRFHIDNSYKNETPVSNNPTMVAQSSNLIPGSVQDGNIEEFGNKINNSIKQPNLTPMDGYSVAENHIYGKYLEDKDANIIIDDSNNVGCCINHNHDNHKCKYGTTNFPNPRNMNGIDRRIFKMNYQDNMTLQDYINWLFLYTDDESALSYEHYKFYNELKKGGSLKYVKGICPPSARRINKPITSNEYYTNLYDDLENSNFTKLINESKIDITKAQDPKELNDEVKKATEIHGKQLKGYNYLAYTRLDKYET